MLFSASTQAVLGCVIPLLSLPPLSSCSSFSHFLFFCFHHTAMPRPVPLALCPLPPLALHIQTLWCAFTGLQPYLPATAWPVRASLRSCKGEGGLLGLACWERRGIVERLRLAPLLQSVRCRMPLHCVVSSSASTPYTLTCRSGFPYPTSPSFSASFFHIFLSSPLPPSSSLSLGTGSTEGPAQRRCGGCDR